MEDILDAPSAEQQRLQYAGFWIRAGAFLIDWVLLFVLQVVIMIVVAGTAGNFSYDGDDPEYWIIMSLIFVLQVTYYAGMESSSKGGTLGKMAVGIRVSKANGDRISFINALGRLFAKIPSWLIVLIGFIMVAWDDKKQGLHDKLANTYVVYK